MCTQNLMVFGPVQKVGRHIILMLFRTSAKFTSLTSQAMRSTRVTKIYDSIFIICCSCMHILTNDTRIITKDTSIKESDVILQYSVFNLCSDSQQYQFKYVFTSLTRDSVCVRFMFEPFITSTPYQRVTGAFP